MRVQIGKGIELKDYNMIVAIKAKQSVVYIEKARK
jgi:hypothetical protein